MAEENQELRKAGLKVTLPRVKILQILESSEPGSQHLSAEDVYGALRDAGEEVGLATVYRVLTQFESAGLVIRHNFETVEYRLTRCAIPRMQQRCGMESWTTIIYEVTKQQAVVQTRNVR